MNVNSTEQLVHIECPICMHYMYAPIRLCAIGHSLCSQCAAKLYQCPTCKQPLPPNARNYALENIAALCKIPCRNGKYGCNFTTFGAAMKLHEEKCAFTEIKCPLADNGCRWLGCVSAVHAHCMDSHDLRLYTFASERLLDIKAFQRWDRNLKYTSMVFSVHNQLFKFVGDLKVDKTRWCILHLSPDANPTTKYQFKLTFYENQTYDGRKMWLSGQCLAVQFGEIDRLELDKHYLIASVAYLKDLVKSDSLCFKIEINKL